jgi:hypothetical protein
MVITDDMRAPNTPPEVVIRVEPRKPVTDPTLGIAVNVNRDEIPLHRLVTIGDSITHGLQSGAIFNTEISYPMMIAWEMGWDEQLRHPDSYNGWGGLPLNIEWLTRQLERQFGNEVNWWQLGATAFSVRQFMDDVEDHWERGHGSRIPNRKGINHNLGIYGWKVGDIISRNADICESDIKKPKDNLFSQLVENANERAALRVLNMARDSSNNALTPVQAAKALGENGGIETLIVMIGANNALRSVIELRVQWSNNADLQTQERFTVWNPIHFKAQLDKVVTEVKEINARHVIWATVPHVTFAPIARGVQNKVRPGSRYFPYYTRPWIEDKDFDPKDDPKITAQEARAIDSAIDQYNDDITNAVKEARNQSKDWYLFDLAGLLDRLASRRYIDDPMARPDWWTKYELPSELHSLSPVPDSGFFTSDATGRVKGGLFSLDGIHPTTIAYGLVAQELINIMQRDAKVKFFWEMLRLSVPSLSGWISIA